MSACEKQFSENDKQLLLGRTRDCLKSLQALQEASIRKLQRRAEWEEEEQEAEAKNKTSNTSEVRRIIQFQEENLYFNSYVFKQGAPRARARELFQSLIQSTKPLLPDEVWTWSVVAAAEREVLQLGPNPDRLHTDTWDVLSALFRCLNINTGDVYNQLFQ